MDTPAVHLSLQLPGFPSFHFFYLTESYLSSYSQTHYTANSDPELPALSAVSTSRVLRVKPGFSCMPGKRCISYVWYIPVPGPPISL